jgi:hypothetical protein
MLKIHENKKLNVNFKLFSIAIKNLIDNAINIQMIKKLKLKHKMKIFYLKIVEKN